MDLIEIRTPSEEEKKSMLTGRLRENPWILSTIVLAVLITLLMFSSYDSKTQEIDSEEEAGKMLVGFYESQGIEGVKVIFVEEMDELYKIDTKYQGKITSSYVTKTGYLTGNSIIDLNREKLILSP